MSLPYGYAEQRACINCKHVHDLSDYDGDNVYYCTADGTIVPTWHKPWATWGPEHKVSPAGLCESWEEAKK
jgi:hypothetical protein